METNVEKPNTGAAGESSRAVQYDESAKVRKSHERASMKRKRWAHFKKRSDWWFASTAIPLLAATLGPLANVLSIAALVTSWRETVFVDGEYVAQFDGVKFPDPKWCYWLNVASLIFGFLGNIFLLFNFTQRIRYLIALPATIIFWYLSTALLMGITLCMQIYAPPNRPQEIYTQGYWYAVIAAAIYFICSMILMVNMLGYFLKRYPDTFALTDSQRTLILQTMVFFIWLAGGAAIFSRIETDAGQEGWDFADALYFCDVTILTVGFGDLYPTTNLSRGLIFPYSVGGMITLALVISSIYNFMKELGEDKIIQKHIHRERIRTISRTVTNSFDMRDRLEQHHKSHLQKRWLPSRQKKIEISAPMEPRPAYTRTKRKTPTSNLIHRASSLAPKMLRPKPKIILLREQKDRFLQMRDLQSSTSTFKKYYALTFSVVSYLLLWCLGAVVFWRTENSTQGMTYFQALYFCYISLLTIGYGDLSPKSNAGRSFFVVWSLIAVPTMTILVSDMSETVVGGFKRVAEGVADWTILPKQGVWRQFVENHPKVQEWVTRKKGERRVRRGFETMDPEDRTAAPLDEETGNDDIDTTNNASNDSNDNDTSNPPTIPTLAQEAATDDSHTPSPSYIVHHLALSIRHVASDLKAETPKQYSYEEWVEFTRLMRLARRVGGKKMGGRQDIARREEEQDEDEEEEWDWLGDNSPLLAGESESEWLLDRLCGALVRVERGRGSEANGES